jgi:F-type H+-transporting ATPase subunit alpha
MADVKPAEVSAILREQLSGFRTEAELQEVGTVLQIGDGIARVYGLKGVQYGELIEFEGGLQGIALNLEEDNVGAVLLGRSSAVKEGDTVKRLGRIASVNVGEGLVGRVIDTLGNPIDGKGPIAGQLYEMPIERKAPGVIFRQPVTEPLQTGIKAVDAMIPIGRGQRELIMVTVKLVKQLLQSMQSLIKKNFTIEVNLFSVFMLQLDKKVQLLQESLRN